MHYANYGGNIHFNRQTENSLKKKVCVSIESGLQFIEDITSLPNNENLGQSRNKAAAAAE